ncbi:Zinc/RING finger protein 3 [Pteropus alecto]|uniref:RING-type E3 ubiquitin transferase n=1 Tax=Pteropus alecto TaxID=9402 RepID=L5L4H9_PTEAL|nr:Zinc/RING finger protein 3 [Pteropus alecto]
MHPLGLCNNNDEEDLYEYGWVGVVKLEQPELDPKPCLTVLGKANAECTDSMANSVARWEIAWLQGGRARSVILALLTSSRKT